MNDKDLKPTDVQALDGKNSLASFFAILGYDTEARLPLTSAALGITAEQLQRHIKSIEQLAVQKDGAEPLYIYLVELTSVTIAATQGLARALKNRLGNYVLVLTDDYKRLDFVLLERTLSQSNGSGLSPRQVSVRPRILTVHRRNPLMVHLRVLRRFTYTEADSDAQYDKLLSAYTVAEWSEPLFNNRALFSDYYLKGRLPELPEWQERPETIYCRLQALFADFREHMSGGGQATTQNFLVPAFEALGFHTVAVKGKQPYRFCAAGEPDKPIALCLAYTWNRYLDGRDETRDTDSPEENPGARIVAVLDSGEAPWAIVTNGKLWRLYSARAHSRATNYYEIDLEETLAMADPNEAFRYFYLFFRAAAFVPKEDMHDGQPRQICFLDKLVEESETYAKALGDRLKERVFEQIFPHFAKGFIEYLKQQPGIAEPQQKTLFPAPQLSLKQEPDEVFRRQVFEGTLTLLYRLLFLLYAEARGLLPIKEERGYFEHSLTKLKEEVAKKAGTIYDEAHAKIGTAYRADTTTLYDRLLKLFRAIDRGSRDLNVPLYNGGLFITESQAKDNSSEAKTARFLQEHKIPDRYLAMGLDLLTRDVDDKRQDLVFIDYKSLGVRQLGSIYEGLLEFKIRIATEKMAVVKGKRTEEVIPYKKAKKVLTKGKVRNAEERVYHAGDVYLENDRRERKATGSYYTPDHIVKYIIENTVGPVLKEKFEKLRPNFRQAQKLYHQKVQQAKTLKRQGLKPDDPNKIANTFSSLVDELFDLRILDPAMGSGHFLVEAVDFICDRILGEGEGFLRSFPWNPVTASLDDTRRTISEEMERQKISVDTSRLTDINLLKRHVLKRCVYGVDLNPMAVELAKVSLWLDCFTIGAPLSFLDHHLKCGNSLIGTTVQEVQSELANQADLFGSRFQGLLTATAIIEKLRSNPDATATDVENSRSYFTDFEQAQAPNKAVLDIWVSRHFDNRFAEEYLTLSGPELVEQIRSEESSSLPPKYRETINKAVKMRKEKGFFHWDLEFPEAFVDLRGSRWKSKEERGFDAVVGNPPYDVIGKDEMSEDIRRELDFYQRTPHYTPALYGAKNINKLFICQGMVIIRESGFLSFIVPMSLLGDKQAAEVRRVLLKNMNLINIEAFPQKDDYRKRVFREAKLSTTIFVARGHSNDEMFSVHTNRGNLFDMNQESLRLNPSDVLRFDQVNLPILSCTQRDWDIAMEIISQPPIKRIRDYCQVYVGELDKTNDLKNGFISFDSKEGPQLLSGSNIAMYTLREASQGTPIYLRKSEYLKAKCKSKKSRHYKQKRIGWQGISPQNNFRRVIATVIPQNLFCSNSIDYIPECDSVLPLDYLVALLNSKILDWYFRLDSTNANINQYQVLNLPTPEIEISEVGSFLSFDQSYPALAQNLADCCSKPGKMPRDVVEAISEMSRRIQEIEARRVLKNRSERSSLSPESQPIQDAIDKVLFRCYGLSDDDAQYIENRLKEML